jgi:glycosyltransferase involved in cell wall biosynthesis
MRIGVNCFLLAAEIGGIRQYFFSLFNQLLAQDSENDYLFFHGSQNLEQLAQLNGDRWRQQAIQIHHPSEIKQYLDQFDLLFCPFSVLSPRPLPKPSVFTLPDIQEIFYPEFFSEADRFSRDRHFRASAQMADQIITHSQFSQDCLMAAFQISADKITIAPHFIDPGDAQEAEILAAPPVLQLPAEFIFYPANLWPHKNHDALLQALQALKQTKNLIIPLVLTGFEQSGGYPLASKITEYGLAAQVFSLGYISAPQLRYLYQRAQLLVFPSLYEGFGLPLLEAIILGCPVVAAKATAIPEVLGQAGLFFDPHSPAEIAAAIAQVWQNQPLRQQLIQQGKQQSEKFSAALTVQKHQQAFQKAMQTYSYPQFLRHYWLNRPDQNLRLAWKWRSRLLPLLGKKLQARLQAIGDKVDLVTK